VLAIAFHLGSDTIRRHNLERLETTFTTHQIHPRARRIVLYDADGDFDRKFEWWERSKSGLVRQPELPVENGRTDILVGTGSALDIQNINLAASMLAHAEYAGYWARLGRDFEIALRDILKRHLLVSVINTSWVHTNGQHASSDEVFLMAIQELTSYAFDEAVREQKEMTLWQRYRNRERRRPEGILVEIRQLLESTLEKVRDETYRLAHGVRR
jgi:hypothetical protein